MDDATPKKTIVQHLFGWQVVGAVSILLLGIGGGIMTAPHPYIADTFFFAGFGLLLVKFWTWEEAQRDTSRKTAMLLAGVTVLGIVLFAGSCWLSYYLNSPRKSVTQAKVDPPVVAAPTLPPAPTQTATPKPTIDSTPVNPTGSVRPAPRDKAISITSQPQSAQPVPQPTYQQKCDNGSPCSQGPNAQTTVNYGISHPPPNLVGLNIQDAEPVVLRKGEEAMEGELGFHYGSEATFTVASDFPNPQFLVSCDRPCIITSEFLTGQTFGVMSLPSRPRAIPSGRPYEFITEPDMTGTLHPNQEILLRVRSPDNSRVRIMKIASYVAPLSEAEGKK